MTYLEDIKDIAEKLDELEENQPTGQTKVLILIARLLILIARQ